MGEAVDEHLERMAALAEADRRNGSYRRHLLTELGDIELALPRTRRFAPIAVVRAYARRPEQVDRMILSCFVLGLSVRKVSEALLPILGRPISPGTVSQVAKQLDAVVAAFHARPLRTRYRVLMLDGVVLARPGTIKRPVLVALGLRPDGKKEVIDFRLAQNESAAEWERFLGDLIRRGLTGDSLEMICVDGGAGLIAALLTAYPGIPIQRCWAHKIRNILDKVRAGDHDAIKADLHAVMKAKTLPQARSAARCFASLAGRLSQGRRLPARRSRRAVHLLAIQIPPRAQDGQNHQCRRTPLPRGAAAHQTHGRLLGQNLHGPHPLRRLQPRKPKPGRQHPSPHDTNLLTSPPDPDMVPSGFVLLGGRAMGTSLLQTASSAKRTGVLSRWLSTLKLRTPAKAPVDPVTLANRLTEIREMRAQESALAEKPPLLSY